MKVISRTLLAAVLLAAGTNATSATDANMSISATVNAFCSINGGTTTVTDNFATPLTIQGDGTHNSAALTQKSFNIICNKASDIALISLNGAVLKTGTVTPATGFDHMINYTVAATGTFMPATLNGNTATTGTASANVNESLGTTQRTTPGAGTVLIDVTTATTANPLQEGTYSDTLILRITPQ